SGRLATLNTSAANISWNNAVDSFESGLTNCGMQGHPMDLKPYFFLFKSSIVGALGGLLFGFDTAVIAGTTKALTAEYQLSVEAVGFTVSSAVWGTVVSSMLSGIPGDKLGARDTLRIAALLYVISAIGCALAWDLPSLLIFRFIGGLGIGCSSVL